MRLYTHIYICVHTYNRREMCITLNALLTSTATDPTANFYISFSVVCYSHLILPTHPSLCNTYRTPPQCPSRACPDTPLPSSISPSLVLTLSYPVFPTRVFTHDTHSCSSMPWIAHQLTQSLTCLPVAGWFLTGRVLGGPCQHWWYIKSTQYTLSSC